MDNTETHYINYDPDELWDAMILAYIEAGGDVLYAGDEKEILLRAVQAIAVSTMAKVDTALRMDTLTYAVREYLDLYGEKRGCARIAATPATAAVQINFKSSGVAQTIPAGTALTADGVVLYALAEDVAQTGAIQAVTAPIVCQEDGAVGNGLSEGTQLQFVQSNPAVASVFVTTAASGGLDAEADDDYRERIRTYGLTTITTGPSSAYEAAAEAVSTMIYDAAALQDGDGVVGIYLVVDAEADAQALIQAVGEALSARDKRPMTDSVQVQLAEAVPYTLHVKAYYPTSLNLATSISETVDAYQAWQDHAVGRAFNPDKLTADLYQLGVTRVQYHADDGIDQGGAVYTEIPARAHCAGTIEIELAVIQ